MAFIRRSSIWTRAFFSCLDSGQSQHWLAGGKGSLISGAIASSSSDSDDSSSITGASSSSSLPADVSSWGSLGGIAWTSWSPSHRCRNGFWKPALLPSSGIERSFSGPSPPRGVIAGWNSSDAVEVWLPMLTLLARGGLSSPTPDSTLPVLGLGLADSERALLLSLPGCGTFRGEGWNAPAF